MREILFKAKRIDNGKWVEGYVFDDGLVDSKRIFIGGLTITDYKGTADDKWEVGTDFYEVDPNTICQYTGLTEKNGRKIWENDIVQDTYIHLLGSVEYDEEHGMYVINEVNDGYQNFQEFWSCTEVIGNIFDNPELLEGGAVE